MVVTRLHFLVAISSNLFLRNNSPADGSSLDPEAFASGLLLKKKYHCPSFSGTQRQFSENVCSEDELRSRTFGTFVVKFLACLPLLIFERLKNGIIAHFQRIFTLTRSPIIFGTLFFWLKFSKRKVLISIIFGSLDFQLGNPHR